MNALHQFKEGRDSRASSNQAKLGDSLLPVAFLMYKHSISFVGDAANGSFHQDTITDLLGLKMEPHHTAIRKLFRNWVAFHYEINRSFLVDRRNGRILPANSFLSLYLRWNSENHVIAQWQPHNPLWIGKSKLEFERVRTQSYLLRDL